MSVFVYFVLSLCTSFFHLRIISYLFISVLFFMAVFLSCVIDLLICVCLSLVYCLIYVCISVFSSFI